MGELDLFCFKHETGKLLRVSKVHEMQLQLGDQGACSSHCCNCTLKLTSYAAHIVDRTSHHHRSFLSGSKKKKKKVGS
jgi:hypothetical protein